MRLNERSIRKLTAPETGYVLIADSEIPGFAVRITAARARAFVLTYVFEGRQRRYTIGRMPAWTATAAREEAKALRRRIDKGIDPLAAKQERREAPTFAAIAREYLERHAAAKKTGDRDAEYLRRDVLPKWGAWKAADIKRRDIIRLVEEKAEAAPIAANRLLALLRKLFNWAISRDLLEANPCVQVKAPAAENRRERVLNELEIGVFWHALKTGVLDEEPLTMSTEVRAILRLILATGQRPGEVCSMEWSEIDGEWWTIPAGKAKNKRAHRVPLTNLARGIIFSQPAEASHVFPSPRGAKAIQVNALSHALRHVEHLGLEHFTPHDLRRTVSDWLARMGVDGRARSAVLNHKEAGVTERHYTVYGFDREKQAALQRWEKKLRAITSGRTAKVIAIRKRDLEPPSKDRGTDEALMRLPLS